MDELLSVLFAAAVQFSGLPAISKLPPVQAMPYGAMLQEVCADLKDEIPALRAQYDSCVRSHKIMPLTCAALNYEAGKYDRCMRQGGLMAAYIIEQRRIVYRDELDLENDSDNSFIVHEYVHALQEHYFGDQMFENCQGVMSAEKQAYRAQQRYLQSRGQLLRVGDRLRFVTCNDVM
jgi:hypothetical protein